MDPSARFRRSLFGYSPKRVRAYVEQRAKAVPISPEPQTQELEEELRDLEEELEVAHAELETKEASVRSSEAAANEARAQAREAERRAAELEAELGLADQRAQGQTDEVRTLRQRVESLTEKLDAQRSTLAAEIQKVWTAEMRAHAAGGELAAAGETLRRRDEELAAQRSRADEAEARAGIAEREAARGSDPWTLEDVTPVLDMAEQAMTGIVAEARRRGEDELRELQEEVEQLRAETIALRAWCDRVAPLVAPIQRSVEQARLEADRVGGLVRQVLEPMTWAVATLGERLVDLTAAAVTEDTPGIRLSESVPSIAVVPDDVDGPDGTEAKPANGIVDVSDETADSR